MATVSRRYEASSYVTLRDLEEGRDTIDAIADYVEEQRKRCAECAGNCTLRSETRQFYEELPDEAAEFHIGGQQFEEYITTSVTLECHSPHCEASGLIGEVAEAVEQKAFAAK